MCWISILYQPMHHCVTLDLLCKCVCNLVHNLHLNQQSWFAIHIWINSHLNLNVSLNFISLQSPRTTLNVDRPLPPASSSSSGEYFQAPSLVSVSDSSSGEDFQAPSLVSVSDSSSGEDSQAPFLVSVSDSSEDDLLLSFVPGVSSGADPKLMLSLSSSSSLWLAPPCTSWTWPLQKWQQGQETKSQEQAVKPPAFHLTGMSWYEHVIWVSTVWH